MKSNFVHRNIISPHFVSSQEVYSPACDVWNSGYSKRCGFAPEIRDYQSDEEEEEVGIRGA